MQLVTIEVNW